MYVLIVEKDAETLESCAAKFADLGPEVISVLQLEIHLALEKNFLNKLEILQLIQPHDFVLVFGPSLENQSAALARKAKEISSSFNILIFLSERSFKLNTFKSEKDDDIRKVLLSNISLGDLEHQLLSIKQLAPKQEGPFKRYKIVRNIGVGTIGTMYHCKDKEGRNIAMKILFKDPVQDPTAMARFRNEIIASYGVNHPNVVRAYEYFNEEDIIGFTTEYVGGGDLRERINADGSMSIAEVTRILFQLSAGLQAIHSTGIIHRDIKPENVLFTESGDVKITDFGIARMNTGPRITEHGNAVGTIDYVSPEYLEKGQVDFQSDIYALGIMGYEMLTGEPPFKGKSVIETMTIRLKSDPPSPKLIRHDCPEELETIVLKAMSRDPKGRYKNASDILSELKPLIAM